MIYMIGAFPYTGRGFAQQLFVSLGEDLKSFTSLLADRGGDRQIPTYRIVPADGRWGDLKEPDLAHMLTERNHISLF